MIRLWESARYEVNHSYRSEQRCKNMHLEVTLRFCHLHVRQVHLSVRGRDLALVK